MMCAMLVLAGCSGSAPAASSSAGSSSAQVQALENCSVSLDSNFGHVKINVPIDDFNALGFAYGDEVDIVFSNGYRITVPYFSGYYGRVGERMLVAYPGHEYVLLAENCGDSMWEIAGLAESDTATVTLANAGAYADVQESFNIAYSDERSDFESDVEFANFRSLSGGSIAPNTVYRSASPVDDSHNRSAYVNELMAAAGVHFVLNLSDDDAEMDENQAKASEKGADLATASFAEPARAYLRMGGMADEQIDALVARITA